MDKRELMMAVAMKYLGTPYVWGGDDPSGFDCSGFVCECLQSVGLIPRGADMTAQALCDRFRKNRVDEPWKAKSGDLVFWRAGAQDGRIIHVEMMLDTEHSIGASGGGSSTKSPAEAWKQNAYIKIRPIASRPFCAGIFDPHQ